MKRRLFLSVSLIGALTVSYAHAQSRPPGLAPDPSSVEAGLWQSSERMERAARASAERNTDEALSAYVRNVLCSIATEYCAEVRIYVMDRQLFNATAAPNGYIEVWSGLLLRAENDAQLAFVLGHEITHFGENHSLEQWNNTKGWATAAMVITLGAGLAGVYYGVDLSSVGDLAYLAALSSIFSYGRGHESEADRLGLQRAAAAGYDPREAARIWSALQQETRASTFSSVRREEASPSLFRTHPLTDDRIEALEAQASAMPSGGRADRRRHREAIRPFLPMWLEEELLKRDFGGFFVVLDRLAVDGEDLGVIEFYRGEGHRQRRGDGDLQRARDAYARSVEHADAPLEAWRELGDASRRLGDAATARIAWSTYLEKAVDADDRWIVEDSLKALGG